MTPPVTTTVTPMAAANSLATLRALVTKVRACRSSGLRTTNAVVVPEPMKTVIPSSTSPANPGLGLLRTDHALDQGRLGSQCHSAPVCAPERTQLAQIAWRIYHKQSQKSTE
jgi:hypothetical protein